MNKEIPFTENVSALMKGLDNYATTKSVVGDPIVVGDSVIIPLSDVQFGMGTGSFAKDGKNSGVGGLTGKVTPSAVLLIQNKEVRLINIKNQDAMTKFLDMIPGIIDRFTKKDEEMDPEVKEKIDELTQA